MLQELFWYYCLTFTIGLNRIAVTITSLARHIHWYCYLCSWAFSSSPFNPVHIGVCWQSHNVPCCPGFRKVAKVPHKWWIVPSSGKICYQVLVFNLLLLEHATLWFGCVLPRSHHRQLLHSQAWQIRYAEQRWFAMNDMNAVYWTHECSMLKCSMFDDWTSTTIALCEAWHLLR